MCSDKCKCITIAYVEMGTMLTQRAMKLWLLAEREVIGFFMEILNRFEFSPIFNK
jgi:hypothetical protein